MATYPSSPPRVAEPVALELVVERAQPDAEPLGGALAVAALGLDGLLDGAALE